VKGGEPLRADGGWVAGYRLARTGEPGRRTVRVLMRSTGEGGAVAFTEYAVSLVWHGDDWRLVAPAWGDWRSAATALSRPDPAGYTRYDDANTTAGRI